MYAAIDHHKAVFQAAMLDPQTGVAADERFEGSRDGLASWVERWQGRVTDVAIEASTGWRWITQELEAHGIRVHLADPAEARAKRGRTKKAKTDKLDARWLVLLLAKQDLPEAWIPPEEIQQLRAQTRLRKALADDRTRWAQRLHAVLHHEGWPCRRSQLLTKKGRQWVAALRLGGAARQQVTAYLFLIETLEAQLQPLENELRHFAEGDPRCQALRTLFGVGPIIACHLLAEIGSALRFRRSRQLVRLSGLDPIVEESGERRRRGKLAKQGPPLLRWAAVEAAQHGRRYNSPDRHLWAVSNRRSGPTRATLTVARKLLRRSYHVLRRIELGQQEVAA